MRTTPSTAARPASPGSLGALARKAGRKRQGCPSGRAGPRLRTPEPKPTQVRLKPRKPRRKRRKADPGEARLDERPDVGEEAGRGEGADRPPCESPGSRMRRIPAG